MIKVTRSMLASVAAERMREQPGCRSVASVEIVDTPDGWELGTITHSGATDSNIIRARIAVSRGMKEKYYAASGTNDGAG